MDAIDNAELPGWKVPKNQADELYRKEFRESKVECVLPKSCHRLSWLKDRDDQLYKLLDYLESIGIPMGADDWAIRAIAMVQRMKDQQEGLMRFMTGMARSPGGSPIKHLLEAHERLVMDVDQSIVMYRKRLPAEEIKCDCCGWPPARRVGGGYAACQDCLPDHKLTGQDEA